MPADDIIDNRGTLLADRVNRILPSTERAESGVGYFFLSGMAPIRVCHSVTESVSGSLAERGTRDTGRCTNRTARAQSPVVHVCKSPSIVSTPVGVSPGLAQPETTIRSVIDSHSNCTFYSRPATARCTMPRSEAPEPSFGPGLWRSVAGLVRSRLVRNMLPRSTDYLEERTP